MIVTDLKVGILGGGQLGKMLCIAAAPWHLELFVMDKSADFPAAPYCHHFTEGDFNSEEEVIAFGETLDIITIEIEGVSIKGLHKLKSMGKTVIPDPDFLEIVRDKGRQNAFYRDLGVPTVGFSSFDSLKELEKVIEVGNIRFPFVWKSRFEGYDGRGVKLVKRAEDLKGLPEGPCISEDLVSIEKELALIVSRNSKGEKGLFDPVEMVFDSRANLLDHLQFPAGIPERIAEQMKQIAETIVDKVGFRGLLAIEFFLTTDGQLLVNEMAPRPHNSGHHTIECCATSQYEQLLRTVLDLPPGDTAASRKGIMYNLLGSPGYTGPARLKGVEQLFATEDAHLHWYGKKQTRPFRKMGHILLAGSDMGVLRERMERLREGLRVVV